MRQPGFLRRDTRNAQRILWRHTSRMTLTFYSAAAAVTWSGEQWTHKPVYIASILPHWSVSTWIAILFALLLALAIHGSAEAHEENEQHWKQNEKRWKKTAEENEQRWKQNADDYARYRSADALFKAAVRTSQDLARNYNLYLCLLSDLLPELPADPIDALPSTVPENPETMRRAFNVHLEILRKYRIDLRTQLANSVIKD